MSISLNASWSIDVLLIAETLCVDNFAYQNNYVYTNLNIIEGKVTRDPLLVFQQTFH